MFNPTKNEFLIVIKEYDDDGKFVAENECSMEPDSTPEQRLDYLKDILGGYDWNVEICVTARSLDIDDE